MAGQGHTGPGPSVPVLGPRLGGRGRGCVLGSEPGGGLTAISGSQIWLTALCLVLVFTVTLSVFPAITAMVTSSTSPGKWSEWWEAEGDRAMGVEGGEGSGQPGPG